MTESAKDLRYMTRALELAREKEGLTRPNPPVGAVVVKNGRVVGEGAHPKAGQPHAEPLALKQAGKRAVGATLYVTLEPCSSSGRTPPCCEAILAAGVSRVVVGCVDPNPVHAGGGLTLLRKAGLQVDCGIAQDACEALIAPFACRQVRGMPQVVVKLGMTLDARIADHRGTSQWITGPEARKRVQEMRRSSDAILVGSGTARKDDPSLLPRPARGRKPLRVVLDAGLTLPRTRQIFTDGKARQTLVVCGDDVSEQAVRKLEATGASVLPLPLNKAGQLPLRRLLKALGQRDVMRVWCEGGGVLAGALIDQGLADEVWSFVELRKTRAKR